MVNDALKKILFFAICGVFFSLFFLVGPGSAADRSPEEIARLLQETYDKTTSMTADFQQVTSMKMSRRDRRGEGTVAILKPGRMRWDYVSPDPQVLVSDGETMSMYFSKSKQMMVMPAKEYLQSDVTYSFFAGTGNILRDFNVMPCEEVEGEEICSLKLVPKTPHLQVEFIRVWVDSNFLVTRLCIYDNYGSVTDLHFSNIMINKVISPDFFSFSPPADTEIVEQ
ncbi:MAG: outer membrane lipoprotein carrier protein LolA [Proteobacteria bacterium]|nr:outer membrane lipoprotein carrier protein LolA [Pseudomonadota bacterium]MBU1717311.1 outer membrane lipoprotein carrier protein LolA [Pseudomonadota bacterium]